MRRLKIFKPTGKEEKKGGTEAPSFLEVLKGAKPNEGELGKQDVLKTALLLSVLSEVFSETAVKLINNDLNDRTDMFSEINNIMALKHIYEKLVNSAKLNSKDIKEKKFEQLINDITEKIENYDNVSSKDFETKLLDLENSLTSEQKSLIYSSLENRNEKRLAEFQAKRLEKDIGNIKKNMKKDISNTIIQLENTFKINSLKMISDELKSILDNPKELEQTRFSDLKKESEKELRKPRQVKFPEEIEKRQVKFAENIEKKTKAEHEKLDSEFQKNALKKHLLAVITNKLDLGSENIIADFKAQWEKGGTYPVTINKVVEPSVHSTQIGENKKDERFKQDFQISSGYDDHQPQLRYQDEEPSSITPSNISEPIKRIIALTANEVSPLSDQIAHAFMNSTIKKTSHDVLSAFEQLVKNFSELIKKEDVDIRQYIAIEKHLESIGKSLEHFPNPLKVLANKIRETINTQKEIESTLNEINTKIEKLLSPSHQYRL